MSDAVRLIGDGRLPGRAGVHCLLDTKRDVGNTYNADDMRLGAEPGEELLQLTLIGGLIDAIACPCPHIEFHDIEARQMIFGKVAVLPVLEAAVEVAREIIVQRDLLQPEA